MSRILDSVLCDEIVHFYELGAPVWWITDTFGVSQETIYKIAKANNVPLRPRAKGRPKGYRICTVNEDFFSVIDMPEKAYWLGFLCADGCIDKTISLVFLGLRAADEEHVRKFARAISSTYKIAFHRSSQTIGTTICSRRLAKDLVKHGCVPRKSLVLEWPKGIPDGLVSHFVRGYFDGNGSLSKNKNRGQWYWQLCSGSRRFLEVAREVLTRQCGVGRSEIYSSNCFRLYYGGNYQVEHILDWLYDGSTSETRLDRKYELYLRFKQERTGVAATGAC